MDRSRGQRRPQSQRTTSDRTTQHRPQHVPGPYPPRPSDDVNSCYRSAASQSQIPEAGRSIYPTSAGPGRPGFGQYEPFSFDEDTQSRLSQPRIDQLVRALETHQINTVSDLRRIEKVSIIVNDPSLRNAMVSAWVYYVNSNNLLNELRGLTEQYAFSSELLDEAKYLALSDSASTQSRNFCLLVLKKIRDENLIPRCAVRLARHPSMWGDEQPSPTNVQQLASTFVREWSRAVAITLRHWA